MLNFLKMRGQKNLKGRSGYFKLEAALACTYFPPRKEKENQKRVRRLWRSLLLNVFGACIDVTIGAHFCVQY